MLKKVLSILIFLQLGFSQITDPVATFSILAYDPETGMIGGAVQSRVFSVGNGVLWGKADVGMVATQAYVDVSYGPKGLKLLEKGLSPDEVVKTLLNKDSSKNCNRVCHCVPQSETFEILMFIGL